MLKRVILVRCKTPGDVLRKLRTDRGLTQKAVADALNVDRATYTFHETGKTQPDLQRIGELAKIFAIPVDALVKLLSNPEEIERARPKSRPPKKVAAKPDSLGQLRPEEKSLIAIFRRCDPSSRQEIYQAAKEKLRS